MSNNVVWHHATINRSMRERRNGHRSAVLWFTGLSGAGKSTVAHAVEARLFEMNVHTYVFDGDNVRHGLCSDLGFSASDRSENLRRIGEMVKLFSDAGVIAMTAFISPNRDDRRAVRKLLAGIEFVEVYCRCPLEVCEARDVKGLYRRARAGEVREFTGISAPYDAPEHAEIVLDTDRLSVEQCVERVVEFLKSRGILAPTPLER
jgi:adenylylsulfate kinase